MAQTVGDIITRARIILQETSEAGTRWTNLQLLGWLNEAYTQFVAVKPDCTSQITEHVCAQGTKQEISGHRLLDVIRGLDGYKQGVVKTLRDVLDTSRRRWHSEPETANIEMFVFDESSPKVFYAYPPAKAGTRLEIQQSVMPAPHAIVNATPSSTEPLRLDDTYSSALLDYVLWRAFSMDAENPGNANRAALHQNAWTTALGLNAQSAVASSPNNEVRGAR